jgi:site-specific DNA-methyltransferase (adenine-specific)
VEGKNPLFDALELQDVREDKLKQLAQQIGIPLSRLKYYNQTNRCPSGRDLELICKFKHISPQYLMLRMGKLDQNMMELLMKNADRVYALLHPQMLHGEPQSKPLNVFQTPYGTLYHGDSLALMQSMEAESIDVIFADPPFNLDKSYPSNIDDRLQERDYLVWTEKWLSECVRLLKDGGSLFIWNLPKWNISTAHFLNNFLTFRDWITVEMKYSFPIPNRLYPSHYALLYFCKGERPNTFHPDRLPMPICPKCKEDLRDYGGYKSKMNPKGINLTDVWIDIFPVRHSKYKKRQGANELPLKLLDRILELASNEGELIFDPFGGAGTTYIAAEIKKRRWIGCEIGPIDDILARFASIEEEKEYLERIRQDYNTLFTEEAVNIRKAKGLWTCDSVRDGNRQGQRKQDDRVPEQPSLFEFMPFHSQLQAATENKL